MRIANGDSWTLGACALCAGLVLGIFLLFPIWAPSWMAEFGAERSSVMLIYSASGIIMTLAFPLVGRLLIRIPAWRVIIAGAVVMGGGAIVAAMIPTFIPFAVVYALLVGTGAALAGVLPCQSLAVRLFPSHVGKIGGLMMIALAVAGVTLPLLFTPLMMAVGWRTALGTAGVIILLVIPPLAIRFMRKEASAEAADATQASSAGLVPAGGFMRMPSFWIILCAIFPMLATSTAIQANLLPVLADHNVDLRGASYILSAMAVGGALGAAVIGWLADRADPRLVLGGSAGLMAVSLVAFASPGGMPIAAGATVLLGLAAGGTLPLLSTFTFRQFGAAYAPAFGVLNSVMMPYMFSPPLIGLIRDRAGSYVPAFLGAVPFLLLGAAIIWLLKRAPHRRDDLPVAPA